LVKSKFWIAIVVSFLGLYIYGYIIDGHL